MIELLTVVFALLIATLPWIGWVLAGGEDARRPDFDDEEDY